MRIGSCRKCKASIMMVRHITTRKLAPIEVEPSDDGNILVTGDTYEVVAKEEREKVKLRGFVLRKTHFATCTFARAFSHAEQAKPLPANVVRFPLRRTR